MKINHKYDIYGRTEPSIIYLAKPGKRLYCALGGIDQIQSIPEVSMVVDIDTIIKVVVALLIFVLEVLLYMQE